MTKDHKDAPMLIAGAWRSSKNQHPIVDPYRGDTVGASAQATLSDLEDAIAAARKGADAMAAIPGHERQNRLQKIAGRLLAEKAEIAKLLSRESGKALRDSQGEIDRAVDTFSLSAGEAIRIEGRHVPLDGSAMGAGRYAFLLRFPVGVVAAITPFNAPVNLTAHKIAPALAAGNAIVLKPPPQTPLAIQRMIEIVQEAGFPDGALNVVHGGVEIGKALVAHPGVDFITFTGSTQAGTAIKAGSGLKRVALELGGNGVTIVHSDADITAAATACARNSMRLAGQSCISVQTVLVERSRFDAFMAILLDKVRELKLGDPLDPTTDVGTLIDEAAAKRVESWVGDAREDGAKVLTGGARHGAAHEPTVLVDVKPQMEVVCNEVFGPVVSILPYDDLSEVVDFTNRSRFGLQCGIFTASNQTTFDLVRKLKTGGIIVNGTSTWRTDQLAYGGVRDSGMGREGPRYAIEDMTDQRLVVFNL